MSRKPVLQIHHVHQLAVIPATCVLRVNVPNLRLGWKMTVPAEDFAHVWILQQHSPDLLAAKIRLCEIPLCRARRREKLAERELMNRCDHARMVAQRVE